MSKIYVLQKDLPDSKAGDEYVYNESHKRYFKNGNVQDSHWTPECVEHNESWFKEKDEKIKIEHFKLFDQLSGTNKEEFWYQFSATQRLDFCAAATITKIVQSVVNGGLIYSEEDMRECFKESRKTHPLAGFKYDTFEDYKKKNNLL